MTEILREAARGQECKVRSDYCNHNPETTVLAHWNGAGVALKHPDLLGAHACSDCHDYVDSRTHKNDMDFWRKYFFAIGVIRTIYWVIQHDYIQIVKPKSPKISKYLPRNY